MVAIRIKARFEAFIFETTKELIEAAKPLEACMREGQLGKPCFGKQKDINYFTGRPLPLKMNKGQLSQIRKEGGKTIGFSQSTKVGSTSGQPNLRCSFTRVCSVGKGI